MVEGEPQRRPTSPEELAAELAGEIKGQQSQGSNNPESKEGKESRRTIKFFVRFEEMTRPGGTKERAHEIRAEDGTKIELNKEQAELLHTGDDGEIEIVEEDSSSGVKVYRGELKNAFRGKEREQIYPKNMPEPGEPQPTPEPAKGPEPVPEPGQKKEVLPKSFEEVLASSEDPFAKAQKEVVEGAIKVLEEKTGKSLAFGEEPWGLIKKYIGERGALVFSRRAEEYLQGDGREVAKARGMDPDAKGVAAVQAVEELGVVQKLIAGDRELENVYTAMVALRQFSRTEIPPSARFAILEQLNALPDNDELKKLRIEVFQKWSGRDPVTWTEANINTRVDHLLKKEILPERETRLIAGLSPGDKEIASRLRITEKRMALMKELEYQFIPKGWVWKKIEIQRGGIEVHPVSIAVSDISPLEEEWAKKVCEEVKPELVEKAKIELGSSFAKGVTGVGAEELNRTYDGLKKDILAQFERNRIASQRQGEKAIEGVREISEGKGKGVKQLMREGIENWEEFSGDRAKLLEYLKDEYDIDVSPDRVADFEQKTGLDYGTFAKKRRGFLFYMLRVISYAMQETKKLNL